MSGLSASSHPIVNNCLAPDAHPIVMAGQKREARLHLNDPAIHALRVVQKDGCAGQARA
jgi:hypothetical protein